MPEKICIWMVDLIYRVVLHASRQADMLLISLAGGRKADPEFGFRRENRIK